MRNNTEIIFTSSLKVKLCLLYYTRLIGRFPPILYLNCDNSVDFIKDVVDFQNLMTFIGQKRTNRQAKSIFLY